MRCARVSTRATRPENGIGKSVQSVNGVRYVSNGVSNIFPSCSSILIRFANCSRARFQIQHPQGFNRCIFEIGKVLTKGVEEINQNISDFGGIPKSIIEAE